jgi:hypothetical protein
MTNMIFEPTHRNDVSFEDMILFAYLLAKMPDQKLTAIDSMKWVFLIKSEAYKQQKVLFRSRFKMNRLGPISLQVYGNRDKLVESNFAQYPLEQGPEKPNDVISFSKTSYIFLEWIECYAFKNSWAFDFIDEIYSKYHHFFSNWRTRQSFIYDIEINGKKVKDYNKKTQEPFIMNYYDDWNIFSISDDFFQDIISLLNPQITQEIINSEKNFCLRASIPSLMEEWQDNGI